MPARQRSDIPFVSRRTNSSMFFFVLNDRVSNAAIGSMFHARCISRWESCRCDGSTVRGCSKVSRMYVDVCMPRMYVVLDWSKPPHCMTLYNYRELNYSVSIKSDYFTNKSWNGNRKQIESKQNLEMPGFEPGAFRMQSERSTAELHPHERDQLHFESPYIPTAIMCRTRS